MSHSRHPDDLYKNGIQRSSFVPCIDLIKETFDVTDLDSGTGMCYLSFWEHSVTENLIDYRKVPRALSRVYYSPITPEHRSELDKVFHALTSSSSKPTTQNRKLLIWGRSLNIPESSDDVAKFSFAELCGKPLSAADYLEVTKLFGTVFVTDIPKMDLGHKDMARRFITFIDGMTLPPCVRV